MRPHLGEEPERSLLELRGVAFRDALTPGTLILTSGLGGVYPRGIPIGVVMGEVTTSEVWSRTYLVRPAVYPPDVNNVMILSPERVSSGAMDEVWSSVARADSAARGVAASADSLARLAAMAAAHRERPRRAEGAVLSQQRRLRRGDLLPPRPVLQQRQHQAGDGDLPPGRVHARPGP